MTIKERLKRMEPEDAVYCGNLVDDLRKSEVYDLIVAITESEIMGDLAVPVKGISAEERIGILQGIRRVTIDLDKFVEQRDAVLAARKADEEREKDDDVDPGKRTLNTGSI